MSDPTAESVPFDVIVARYRVELERLNYIRPTINVYLRSIRRLGERSGQHDVSAGMRFFRIAKMIVAKLFSQLHKIVHHVIEQSVIIHESLSAPIFPNNSKVQTFSSQSCVSASLPV